MCTILYPFRIKLSEGEVARTALSRGAHENNVDTNCTAMYSFTNLVFLNIRRSSEIYTSIWLCFPNCHWQRPYWLYWLWYLLLMVLQIPWFKSRTLDQTLQMLGFTCMYQRFSKRNLPSLLHHIGAMGQLKTPSMAISMYIFTRFPSRSNIFPVSRL